MYKTLIFLLFILFYSCGSESINSPSIEYFPLDQEFIDQLVNLNELQIDELTDEKLKNVEVDSGNVKYFRIQKLYLNNMGIEFIPESIGELDELTIFIANDNKITSLPEVMCQIYDNLDSLDISNNDICTPSVPDCIINSMTVSVFYEDQQCEIIPDEEDLDFIEDLISENWVDSISADLRNELNNLTTWETFTEGNKVTSRITEIRYDNKGISNIPISLEDLDSLERIELQENQIEVIPNIIGNLTRLKYITIQKNKISSIPARIGELKKLEVFKIYENELTDVHVNIGNLSKLISLNLSYNKLSNLPESMCDILNNEGIQISIDNNKICSGYPDCFIDLISNSEGQDCP
tara:strand:+ start:886 stop:1938 length:1053 start_codon:yes stop_codon:yes gene_type:complete